MPFATQRQRAPAEQPGVLAILSRWRSSVQIRSGVLSTCRPDPAPRRSGSVGVDLPEQRCARSGLRNGPVGAVAQCRGNRFKPGQVRVRVPLASLRRKDQWLIRLVVRTPGFHPGNGSSILPWVAFNTQHRSPTGRGTWFRSRRLRVRISPVLLTAIQITRRLGIW